MTAEQDGGKVQTTRGRRVFGDPEAQRPFPFLAATFTYLASPYHDPSEHVMAQRYAMAMDATHYLLKSRVWVVSPIVHCHELASKYELPRDFAFWRDYNFALLRGAEFLTILDIDGWRESRGVRAEVEQARRHGIYVDMMTPTRTGYLLGQPLPAGYLDPGLPAEL